jgi:hypothetical protein
VFALVVAASSAAIQPSSLGPAKTASQAQNDATQNRTLLTPDLREAEWRAAQNELLKTSAARVEATDKTKKAHDYTDSEWWLVYLTAGLAATTLGLAIYTAKLYRATVRLGEDARDTSARQATEMKDSISMAKASLDIAERSFKFTNRAALFVTGFDGGPNLVDSKSNNVQDYFVWPLLANDAPTAAHDCFIRSTVVQSGPGVPPVIPEVEFGPLAVLAARSKGRGKIGTIALEVLMGCWLRQIDLYIWTRIDYKDVFGDPHHHEVTAKILFIHDPSTPPPHGHSPYIQFAVDGPRQSSA